MSKSVQFRSIQAVDNDEIYSNHWGCALQVICHILVPLRKAIVHFYLTNRKNHASLEKKEWIFLSQLGNLFQSLIASGSSTEIPIDPTAVYTALNAVLLPHTKKHFPKDATEAMQILLETIQNCVKTLPVTSQLWSALLDDAGLGAIAKQAIVGKKKDDGSLLQRTKRDTRILLCPFPLQGKMDTVSRGLAQTMKQNLQEYDWESKDSAANFEVRIPLWDDAKKKTTGNPSDEEEEPKWKTVKTLQFATLPNYFFIGIPRFSDEETPKKEKVVDDDGDDDDRPLLNPLVNCPMELDVKSYCTSGCENRKFELVAGILYDDEDYVAILKNPNVVAPPSTEDPKKKDKKEGTGDSEEDEDDEDEPLEDWNLMETDEVIPMTQEDVLEFLRGGEEGGEGGGVCGTVLVYKTTNVKALKSNDQLLSDIIISHVSGKLESKVDFYYEEEIIED